MNDRAPLSSPPLLCVCASHNPAKGRTNMELREKFILADGASQGMAAFRPRGRRSRPSSRGASPNRSTSVSSQAGQAASPQVPATSTPKVGLTQEVLSFSRAVTVFSILLNVLGPQKLWGQSSPFVSLLSVRQMKDLHTCVCILYVEAHLETCGPYGEYLYRHFSYLSEYVFFFSLNKVLFICFLVYMICHQIFPFIFNYYHSYCEMLLFAVNISFCGLFFIYCPLYLICHCFIQILHPLTRNYGKPWLTNSKMSTPCKPAECSDFSVPSAEVS